jgi:hypothetical protein
VSATLFMSIEICGGRAWCLFEFIWGVNWSVRCASKELCVKLVWFLCLCRYKPLGIGLIWEYLYSPTPSSLPNLPKLMLLYFLEIIKKNVSRVMLSQLSNSHRIAETVRLCICFEFCLHLLARDNTFTEQGLLKKRRSDKT